MSETVEPSDPREFVVDGLIPKDVVAPGTSLDAAQFLQHAAAEQLAVIPQGHRTRIHCGNLPTRYDTALSTVNLNRLVEFDHENLTVIAEAGMPLVDIQRLLAEKNQMVPLDPPAGDHATVGGIIASNSSGPRRLLWRSPRDLVLGVEVAMTNGEVIKLGGKVMKNVAGYDVTKLFIGSFGTLGVIATVTLRTITRPATEKTICGSLSDWSATGRLVGEILDSSLVPSAIVCLTPAMSQRVGLIAAVNILVLFEGFEPAVNREIEETRRLLGEHRAQSIEEVVEAEQQNLLWRQVRDLPSPVDAAGNTGATTAILKCIVPIAVTAELMEGAQVVADEAELTLEAAAFAGTGVAYLRAVVDHARAVSSVARFVDRTRAVATRLRGHVVAEFVPTGVKEIQDVWGNTREDFPLMRRVKESLDPQDVLCPGRWLGRL